jgi:hypothetical protein
VTKNKKRRREDEQDLKREIVSAEKAGTTKTLTLQMSEPVKGIFEERKKWVDCEVRRFRGLRRSLYTAAAIA